MKLILYKGCKIKKNDVIEKETSSDILTYLNTLEKEEIDNLNLNKRIFNDLTVNIKLNRQLKKIDVYSYNYARIINNDDENYFYFIADKEWVADSTTNVMLFLDTCNTYEYKTAIISDTSKYRRCNVIREHRDRFTSTSHEPIIDKVDEGFGTLPMEVTETKLIGEGDKYYLGYYKSPGTNARTICKVLKEQGEDHTRAWHNLFGTIGTYLTTDTEAMVIYTDVNDTFLNYNADPKDKTSTDFWDNKNLSFLYIRRMSGAVYIYYGTWVSPNKIYITQRYDTTINEKLDLYSDKTFKILKGTNSSVVVDMSNKSHFLNDILGTSYTTEEITNTAGLNFSIPGFNDTLKADSNILKIIEIPYFNEGKLFPYYDFDLASVVAAIHTDTVEIINTFDSKDIYSIELPSTFKGALANKKYEPKLLGSQFTTNMFKYDSFSYSIAAEDMTLPQTAFDINVHIPIDMSTTVAFEFNWKGTIHNEFDRWLITQRNNQVPTMTNAYLEYMQNGYNYDVKNRNIQTALNWASWGTGAAITAASAGLTGFTALRGAAKAGIAAETVLNNEAEQLANSIRAEGYQNVDVHYPDAKELKAANRLARKNYQSEVGPYTTINIGRDAAGVAQGLVNNIVSTVQSKQALEKRKKDYLNTASNISNSDDVTLFNIYNEGNKLRYSKYKPLEEVENSIYEVLRITGYATNQEKIPDLHTRRYYNFLQADVEYQGGQFIPTLMLGDIQNSIARGITLFHNYGNEYDLDKKYENWESHFVDLPEKGDFIQFDPFGKGKKSEFHVIKIDKTTGVAEVLGYSPATTLAFASSGKYYSGSYADNYLNTTWYNTLSETVRNAIVDRENIKQYAYTRSTSFPGYTGSGSVYTTVGTRHVYLTGIKDIKEYCGTTSPTMAQYYEYYTGKTSGASKNAWTLDVLPDSYSKHGVYYFNGISSSFCFAWDTTTNEAERRLYPQFQINLNKIDWEKTTVS